MLKIKFYDAINWRYSMKKKQVIALILTFIFTINFLYFKEVFAVGNNTLKVGIYTQSGTIYESVNVEYKSGDTPYSVLTRVASNVKAKGSGSSVYVSAINGISEFAQGPMSGWVYAVNGARPNAGAGSYGLNPGDKLVWHYTLDLGSDIYLGINKLDSFIAANPPKVEETPTDTKPEAPVNPKPGVPVTSKPGTSVEKPSSNTQSNSSGNVNSNSSKNENNNQKPIENKKTDIENKKDDEDNKVSDEKKSEDNKVSDGKKNEDINLEAKIKGILSSVMSLYERSVNSHWEAIALHKNNGDSEVYKDYVNSVIEDIKSNNGEYSKVTDLEKDIILLNLLSYDVSNIEGINLLEKLLLQDIEKQGSNGVAYGILCINSVEEGLVEKIKNQNSDKENLLTREKLLDILFTYQNSDGGFSLEKEGGSDIDLTAMALQALASSKAFYKELGSKDIKNTDIDETKLEGAIKKAIDYLEKSDFKTSEGISQTIIALTYLGENPEKFGDKNLIEELLKYTGENNRFKHDIKGDEDSIATEQGAIALLSYNRYLSGENPIYENKIASQEKTEEKGSDYSRLYIPVVALVLIGGSVLGFIVYKKARKSK